MTNPGPEPRYKQRLRDILLRLDGWIPPRHVRESLEKLAKNTEDELMRAEHANRERIRRRETSRD